MSRLNSSIRVQKIRLGGKESLDIRRCKNGIPSKRGVSIPAEKVEEVLRALEEASRDEIHVQV